MIIVPEMLNLEDSLPHISLHMWILLFLKSKLQFYITLFIRESNYITLTDRNKETLWIQELLKELKFLNMKATVYINSQCASMLVETLFIMMDSNI